MNQTTHKWIVISAFLFGSFNAYALPSFDVGLHLGEGSVNGGGGANLTWGAEARAMLSGPFGVGLLFDTASLSGLNTSNIGSNLIHVDAEFIFSPDFLSGLWMSARTGIGMLNLTNSSGNSSILGDTIWGPALNSKGLDLGASIGYDLKFLNLFSIGAAVSYVYTTFSPGIVLNGDFLAYGVVRVYF